MISEWPKDGLEVVGRCPLCDSSQRASMHDALVDHVFQSAPGQWSMHRCLGCGCGYLDPRPTQDTIELAYAHYYTHERADGRSDIHAIAGFIRRVAASYVNHRFGTSFRHALPAGHFVARLFPRLRRYLDVSYSRHLDRPSTEGRRLLDVGCGNGEFLHCASALGWDAEGIDLDSRAIAAASSIGCRAWKGDLDDSRLMQGSYEQITMSHVIEHVASPRVQLHRCFDLLAPGGRLWLETPNVDSLGHSIFGAAWRGLEPPRHLVLFNREALTATLKDAGFERIQFKAHPAVALFIWEESRSILAKMPAGVKTPCLKRCMRSLAGALLADYWSVFRPSRSEFLTCVAFRPRGVERIPS